MIKIYVKNEQQKLKANEVMEHEVTYNPNLNGALFEVLVDEDEYPSIDIKDEIEGCKLMSLIFRDDETVS